MTSRLGVKINSHDHFILRFSILLKYQAVWWGWIARMTPNHATSSTIVFSRLDYPINRWKVGSAGTNAHRHEHLQKFNRMQITPESLNHKLNEQIVDHHSFLSMFRLHMHILILFEQSDQNYSEEWWRTNSISMLRISANLDARLERLPTPPRPIPSSYVRITFSYEFSMLENPYL